MVCKTLMITDSLNHSSFLLQMLLYTDGNLTLKLKASWPQIFS